MDQLPRARRAGLSFAGRGGGCRLLSVPTPRPSPLWLATCPLHPGMSPFVCHLLISYVLPQWVCGWCDVRCVCGWAPPECAAAAQCPRVRAPSAVLQRLPVQDPRSLFEGADSRFSYSLVADTARCMLTPLSPTPLAPPPRPPLVGVCMVSCVTCACGATTPGSACYRMAAGGVLGGDASGAPHASFMMVPAAPHRIDAGGSDRL